MLVCAVLFMVLKKCKAAAMTVPDVTNLQHLLPTLLTDNRRFVSKAVFAVLTDH